MCGCVLSLFPRRQMDPRRAVRRVPIIDIKHSIVGHVATTGQPIVYLGPPQDLKLHASDVDLTMEAQASQACWLACVPVGKPPRSDSDAQDGTAELPGPPAGSNAPRTRCVARAAAVVQVLLPRTVLAGKAPTAPEPVELCEPDVRLVCRTIAQQVRTPHPLSCCVVVVLGMGWTLDLADMLCTGLLWVCLCGFCLFWLLVGCPCGHACLSPSFHGRVPTPTCTGPHRVEAPGCEAATIHVHTGI